VNDESPTLSICPSRHAADETVTKAGLQKRRDASEL